MTDTDYQISDADTDAIIADLTEDDLRERSQELSDAQDLWEDLAYVAVPKIPCPECSGRGALASGSLGDICARCVGRRVVDRPGSDPIEMPPFAQLRACITAYGNALADKSLPEGHLGKRHLALPPASTVPTLEAIQKLTTEAKTRSKALAGAPGLKDVHALPAARDSIGDNDLTANEDTDIEDAELDELEKTVLGGSDNA